MNYNDNSWDNSSNFQNQGFQNQGFQNQGFQSQNFQGQNQNWGSVSDNRNLTPVTTGEWVALYFISMIPCINIIMLFIWAFGSGVKESKKNFCKAMLILIGVVVGLMILMYSIIGVSLFASLT